MVAPRIKLKRYRHFDGNPSEISVAELLTNPARISQHPFYPLLSFSLRWTKFAKRGVPGKTKNREILYAARKDAAIMAHFRELLAQSYENALIENGLCDCVLAYRKIEKVRGGGKCNIDFALDAFASIRERGNSQVFAFDISDFFGSLDHNFIESIWKRLRGVARLPEHELKVLNRITRYAYVDMNEAFVALKIKGNVLQRDGKSRVGYLKHKDNIGAQICFPDEFRKEIANKDLIITWKDRGKPEKGIPQGLPISDLIANAYMLDFDVAAHRIASFLGGEYLRYSDDIFFVFGPSPINPKIFVRTVASLLVAYAPSISLNKKKTEIGRYRQVSNAQVYKKVHGGSGDGASYLGFRYDGQKVYLRNSTISSLRRGFAGKCNAAVERYVRSLPGKTASEVFDTIPKNRLISRVGKVEDFEDKHYDKRNWTFYTYAARAHTTFKSFGSGINRQLRRNNVVFDNQIRRSISAALERARNPSSGSTRKRDRAVKV